MHFSCKVEHIVGSYLPDKNRVVLELKQNFVSTNAIALFLKKKQSVAEYFYLGLPEIRGAGVKHLLTIYALLKKPEH